MAEVTTKQIRDRILAILAPVTVAGTKATVAPRIPAGAADYEGYILHTQLSSVTSARTADSFKTETQIWLVRVMSPQLGLGLLALNEDYLYDYRDAVLSALCKARSLQLNGVGLASVQGAVVTSDRMQAPFIFNDEQRALWECTLQISLLKKAGC